MVTIVDWPSQVWEDIDMAGLDEKRLYTLLGANIRTARTKVGLNQDDLAGKIGLLRTSVANIESGRQKPTLGTIYRVCLGLNVSLNDILPPLEDCVQHGLFDYLEQDNLPEIASEILKKYKG